MVCVKDKKYLRELALTVKQLSQRDIEKEKVKLWTEHNDLKSKQPVIFCDPENGWNEIITQNDLVCEDPVAQGYEFLLKREIISATKIKDDKVISTEICVPYSYTESNWGFDIIKHGGNNGSSYNWESPLSDYSMLDQIKYPKITINKKASDEYFDMINDIFGDILDVKRKQMWWWSLGLTWTLIDLRGLEQMMLDMYDYEDELHSLMAKLRDGTMQKLDFLEQNELLSSNIGNTYVGSGGFGFTNDIKEEYPTKLKNMWGFCESQETSEVSGEMFNEFVLPYQLPILERFGLNCYGCCEAIDRRWDFVKKIPNLRRVSVSPWANKDTMSQMLTDKYIYSYKANPAMLAVDNLDEELVRQHLREVISNTKDNILEIIVKDNHTLNNNPENLYRFTEIAKEEFLR